MLDHALALAARGWAVFPCREGAKLPATAHGFHDATTDEAQIRKWWGRNPQYNVAVATGPVSGFWALDMDPKDGGREALAELVSAHGPLPVTLAQATGRDGEHSLFTWTEGVRNRGRFAPGLDVRGDGGYILVAPSQLEGAGSYRWLVDAPICAAPAWLIGLVIKHSEPNPNAQGQRFEPIAGNGRASAYGEKVLIGECHTIATCPPGAQDDTLIRRATRVGSFVGGGEIQEGYAIECLVAAGLAMPNGDPRDPWTVRVIEDKVRRGIEFGRRDPNKAPERARQAKPSPQLKVVGGTERIDPETGEVFEKSANPFDNSRMADWKSAQWMRDLPWAWKDDDNLKPASLMNAKLMVEHHPQLQGIFQYDSFGDVFHMRRGLPGDARTDFPRELTDHDEVALASWLNTKGLFLSIANVGAVMKEVASRNTIDPLRAYIDGLQWDGTARIDGWLNRYLGVGRSEYSDFVGRLFLISAVARAVSPGCKCDTMLILEGEQGLKKSSAARALASPEFFSDQIGDITNKDSSQLIQGRWMIEVPEMDKFSRHEANAVKDYLARQEDRYRPPYGRNVVNRPRRCVFIGTINPTGSGYIKDPTGARRFWPVECTSIDLDAIRLDRDQLWAEAVEMFNIGEKWWVDDGEVSLVKGEQEDRIDDDIWEPKIIDWLRDKRDMGAEMFTLGELLSGAVGLDAARQGQREKLRVAGALTKLGCVKATVGRGKDKVRAWTFGRFK